MQKSALQKNNKNFQWGFEMKHRFMLLSMVLILVLSSFSCALPDKTIKEVKWRLNCVEYKEGMKWEVVQENFGVPDVAPIPLAGEKLSENARVYKGKTVIFYTELKKISVGEKIRFEEVVTKLEICSEK